MRSLVIAVAFILWGATAGFSACLLPGDFNGDGVVSITELRSVINSFIGVSDCNNGLYVDHVKVVSDKSSVGTGLTAQLTAVAYSDAAETKVIPTIATDYAWSITSGSGSVNDGVFTAGNTPEQVTVTALHVTSGRRSSVNVVVTGCNMTLFGSDTLIAPGYGLTGTCKAMIVNYSCPQGGVVIFSGIVGKGISAASFDVTLDSQSPCSTAYDISPGGKFNMICNFNGGQKISLGTCGNWFSAAGSTNTVNYAVTLVGK